jgi:hypothetical protein
MDRRTVLRGGITFAVASPAAMGLVAYDPLLATIRAYKKSLADFNQNAPADDDGANAYSDISYGPHLAKLQQWTQPALTKQSAIEALQISIDDVGGVYNSEASTRMIKAALAFLRGMTD